MRGSARRIFSIVLSFGLLFQQAGLAQVAQLNIGDYVSGISARNALRDTFRPPQLRYFLYDGSSDLVRVLVDKGDLGGMGATEVEHLTAMLMNYFLVGVVLPDECFWVNLQPGDRDRIIDPDLEETDVGRILLEADLQLKKDMAHFMSPQCPEGRVYWDKMYKKASELFGSDNVEINTVTRPWIVPGEIIIREAGDSAYVYKAGLKVMLEQDHVAGAVYPFEDERYESLNAYSADLVRETILPQLTRVVNSSEYYAAVRQVFYSLVLARWFKNKFHGTQTGYAALINSRDLAGLKSSKAWSKDPYFKEYEASFSSGVYVVNDRIDTPTGQTLRRCLSGGFDFTSGMSGNNDQFGLFKVENPAPPMTVNAVLLEGTSSGILSVAPAPSVPSLRWRERRSAVNEMTTKNTGTGSGSSALSQDELGSLFQAQKKGEWRTVQKMQAALRSTLLDTYRIKWEEFKRKNSDIKPFFTENNPDRESHTITREEADKYNLKGHLAEFIKKSDASTAGIRAFIDLLHSENPTKMYNDMFLSLLIETEAEFLREVHAELTQKLPKTQEGVLKFAARLRQEMEPEVIRVVEDVYDMPLESVIPFLRDNVVKLVGGEVRVHTGKNVETEARILAEKGIKVITLEQFSDSVPIYMFSFLTYILGTSGATHYTSSHSANYLYGRKSLSPDGAQLLPDVYEKYRRILKRIIEEDIYHKGSYTVTRSARDSENIISRLSYERMAKLYRSVLNITEKEIDQINEATKKGHRIVLNGLNGSTWKMVEPLFKHMGINTEVFVLMMEQEDSLFSAGYVVTQAKDGSYSVDHLGIDTTLGKVVQTIPYSDLLSDLPAGTRVYELDPDSDRFVVKQIIDETPENMQRLNEYAIAYYKLGNGKILAAPSPNKAFLVLDIVDHEIMRANGTWDDFWSMYYITYVSTRAWAEFAESVPGLIRVMAQVGFKNLTALQRSIEDWYFNQPEKFQFTFTDQLGRSITVDRTKKIRIHSKEEESGGRVAGMNKASINVLGQKVLAMPEKSAADGLLSELLFSSRLYLENDGMQGRYSFLNFMHEAFERYRLKSKVDVRIDLEHGNQGEIATKPYEEQQRALSQAGIIKTNFNNFFFSLGKAVRDGIITIERARHILSEVVPQYSDTWSKMAEMTLTEEALAEGKTRPEGVPIVFREGALVTELDFRPSGTDPLKSKIYIDAEQITAEQVKEIEKTFLALTNYNLYDVLEKYEIPSIAERPDFNAAEVNLLDLPVAGASSSIVPSRDQTETTVSNSLQERVLSPVGGVDFRALPGTIQPIGSFNALTFGMVQLSESELRSIDIESELTEIHEMLRAGVCPSGSSIKQLLAACVQNGEIEIYAQDFLHCLIEICKSEENMVRESSAELREAIAIVENVLNG
jgi:phosphomannomutase